MWFGHLMIAVEDDKYQRTFFTGWGCAWFQVVFVVVAGAFVIFCRWGNAEQRAASIGLGDHFACMSRISFKVKIGE